MYHPSTWDAEVGDQDCKANLSYVAEFHLKRQKQYEKEKKTKNQYNEHLCTYFLA